MKRQQLFNSLWLTSTAAVFATQPALAASFQVTGVEVNPTVTGVEVLLKTPNNKSPQVSTSSYGKTFNVDIANTRLHLPKGKTFRASNPAYGIASISVTPLDGKNIRVSVVGNTYAPAAEVLKKEQVLVLSLTPSSKNSLNQAQNLLPQSRYLQTQSIIVGQKPQDTVQPTEVTPTTPNSRERLLQLLRQPTIPTGSDIPTSTTPIPSYLNPSPNPLQFPTRPEEVEVLGVEPITLQQAFELARRNNRDLQVAQLTLERSRAALREVQAELYPNLNLNTDLTRTRSASSELSSQRQTGQNSFLQQLGLNQDTDADATTSLSGALQLSYDIYTSGLRPARIQAAEEQVRFDQLDVERLTEQIRLDVATNYYNLQQADEQVRISRSAVANAQASLRDAQALEQAGVGTRFDVLQAQVELADATQEVNDALSQQQISRRQLAELLSLPQSVSVTTADPVEIAGLWNLSLAQSIVQAFQNRAELRQQLAQRNISQQQRLAALATNRPQVSLIASYDALEVFDDDESIADGYSLGGRLTWNLYDGGAARARARQEEANIAIAETNFADQRNEVRFEVEQAYADLQSSLNNIQTASVALEQAREALRLARLRFQAGVGTQTDVITPA